MIAKTARRTAVVCAGVTKFFGSGDTRVQVLRGIDVEVAPGEITLLVGPSGCGKTTLISIVAGLLEPTGGDVRIFDRRLGDLRGDALVAFRARMIGFVFQQYNLLPALTAAENASLPLVVQGRRRSDAIREAREMLAAVGLGGKADAHPGELSGGQQQRVAIARALVHRPRLLVCDEPTAALDAESGRTVMELLRRVSLDADRAVIVVTHDNRVYRYGDRIIEMDDGRVTGVSAAADFRESRP
ncbi:MAG: ABC transporter ATP-binding protein [Planctomycetota bacterium]